MAIQIYSPIGTRGQFENIVAVTGSSNTFTIDFDAAGNNYSFTTGNAATTINFSNLDADVVGKSGTIVITNASSTGSLSFQQLPTKAYTTGGSEISWHTGANAISVLSYFIIASNKVLINYVGAFGSYPQP